MQERVLVTGISGQDGAYLAKHLLDSGIEVFGGMRRTSTPNLWRLEHLNITDRVKLVPFDLLEDANVTDVIRSYKFNRVYNLGAQSFVAASFKQPVLTTQIDALGVLRLLEAIRHYSPETRFYQASTSEMFGKIVEPIQSEKTPFYPRSPYGVAKLYGHWITVNYREAYNLHASSGILFNHESPLRGLEFVTRKITAHLAQIRHGLRENLRLGNLDAKRDWGHARDYVRGMALMTEQAKGDDYVLATGVTTTVRDFVRLAGEATGFDLHFEGEGTNEVGIEKRSGKRIVVVDPEYFRPSEVETLIGDASKAQKNLGWTASTPLASLVTEMATSDMNRVAKGHPLL